jgi:hypothetical protein
MQGCDHGGEAPSAVQRDKEAKSQDQRATDSAGSIDSRSDRKYQESQPVLAVQKYFPTPDRVRRLDA